MFTRAAWMVAIGVAVFLINRSDNPGPAGTLLVVFCVDRLGISGGRSVYDVVEPQGQAEAARSID